MANPNGQKRLGLEARRPTSVTLEPRVIDAVERAAREQGVTRSTIINDMLIRELGLEQPPR